MEERLIVASRHLERDPTKDNVERDAGFVLAVA
jgi:hypothetical protein